MAPHSSTFAWKIPWKEEPGRLQSKGCKELDTTEHKHLSPGVNFMDPLKAVLCVLLVGKGVDQHCKVL